MRRYWLPVTFAAIFVLALLFFGGILTGQSEHESQHPYSRERIVRGAKWGRPFENRLPNAMSDFYHKELKQPQVDNVKWIVSETAYELDPGKVDPRFTNPTVAPVTYLDVDKEVAFLRELRRQMGGKGNKVCLAVIHSLYLPRKNSAEPGAKEWNKQQINRERERVQTIFAWYELDRKKHSVTFSQWWRENAGVFGITPDGDPATQPAAASKG